MSQKLPGQHPISGDYQVPVDNSPPDAMPMSIAQQLIGQNVLITVDNWFFAPNGRQYRAVWGTLAGVHTAESTLGIRPNGKSSNWYLEIGNTVIAGCQIHYAIRAPSFNAQPVEDYTVDPKEGFKSYTRPTTIFNANADYVS